MESYPENESSGEEQRPEQLSEPPSRRFYSNPNGWLIVIAALLLVAAALGFNYGFRQEQQVSKLTAEQTQANAAIGQMQAQLASLNTKLEQMTAVPPAAPLAEQPPAAASVPASTTAPAVKRESKARVVAKRHGTTAQEKRWKEMQARLDAQQKQLDATEDAVSKTRTDLEGSLSSTRDELNGSIAKNHDELVALERRGERSYFEFDLTKAKQFQRSGPLLLSLRKADTKHKSYDMALIVDDNQISKKHVDLYEPIWLHAGDDLEPVQLVVNEIDKDHVHGYVSAPKYAERRQAAPATPESGTPAAPSATPAAPNANPATPPAAPAAQQSPQP
jgi:predicted negative regulator of RcsB-dependent stress response